MKNNILPAIIIAMGIIIATIIYKSPSRYLKVKKTDYLIIEYDRWTKTSKTYFFNYNEVQIKSIKTRFKE